MSAKGTRTFARIVPLTAFHAEVVGSSKGRIMDTCESCSLCCEDHAQHDLRRMPSCSTSDVLDPAPNAVGTFSKEADSPSKERRANLLKYIPLAQAKRG